MSALSSFTRLGNLLMLGARGELGHVTDQKTVRIDPELSRNFAAHTANFLKQYAANLDDHRFRIGMIYQSRQPKPWGAETLLLTDAVVRMLYPVSGIRQNELTTFQQKKRENSVYYGMELLLEYALKDSPGIPIFVPILFDRGTTLSEYDALLRDTLAKEDSGAPVVEVLNLIGPASTSHKDVEMFVALKERIHSTFVKKDARKSVEMKIMESMRGSKGPTPAHPRQTIPSPPASAATPTVAAPGLNTDTAAACWYHPALHDATCEKLQRYLLQPREYAEVEHIRHLLRFRELTMNQQKDLATSCPVYAAPPNTVLLERGTTDQWNLYLLQGDLQLTAADGGNKVINGGTDNSNGAIAALKPRKFTVTTLSRARFLWVHENIIAEIQQRRPGSQFELVS